MGPAVCCIGRTELRKLVPYKHKILPSTKSVFTGTRAKLILNQWGISRCQGEQNILKNQNRIQQCSLKNGPNVKFKVDTLLKQ